MKDTEEPTTTRREESRRNRRDNRRLLQKITVDIRIALPCNRILGGQIFIAGTSNFVLPAIEVAPPIIFLSNAKLKINLNFARSRASFAEISFADEGIILRTGFSLLLPS